MISVNKPIDLRPHDSNQKIYSLPFREGYYNYKLVVIIYIDNNVRNGVGDETIYSVATIYRMNSAYERYACSKTIYSSARVEPVH